MPTGLGNRKVLTPRSSKAPRKSLPQHARLIEAESLSSLTGGEPSSPDILTTKLHEKMKKPPAHLNKTNAGARTGASRQPEREAMGGLTADAHKVPVSRGNDVPIDKKKQQPPHQPTSFADRLATASGSNALSLNAGRSRLSVEEFKAPSSSEPDYAEQPSHVRREPHYAPNTDSGNGRGNNFDRWSSSTAFNASIDANKTHNHPSGSGYHGYGGHNHNDHSNSSGDSMELLQEQLGNLRREYEGLKQRFSDLSRLRSTEAETLLEEYKRRSEARDVAAERTIKALQGDNERLKKQLAETRQQPAEESAEEPVQQSRSDDEDESLTTRISELERLVKIQSGFSGLAVEPAGENRWECDFASRTGRFSFVLSYDPSLHRYQYLPVDSATHSLPPFLATDILITPDQMQIFFWRMLDTLTRNAPK